MKAAIYARGSDERINVYNQLEELKPVIERDGCTLEKRHVYSESESAWKDRRRPAFDKMMREAGKDWTVLYIAALDRLTRHGVADALAILAQLEQAGVRVVSMRESWLSVDGPMRELLISIIAWAAKFESDRKSERVRATLARLRAEGRSLGRPRVNVSNNAVAALRDKGLSIRAIARELGATKGTVARRLKEGVVGQPSRARPAV